VKYLVITSRDHLLPDLADTLNEIKELYSLHNANAFSIKDANCSTLLHGVTICCGLLEHGNENDTGIVIDIEINHSSVQRFDGIHVSGDGCVGILLRKEHEHNTTSGTKICAYGHVSETGNKEWRSDLHWDTAYMLNLKKVIYKTLDKAAINLKDIKYIFPNNANPDLWEILSSLLRIPHHTFFHESRKEIGNIFGLDEFINYDLAKREYKIGPGNYFAICSIGANGTTGCIVCRED